MKKHFYLLLLLPLPFFAASCGGAKAPHDTEKTRANRLRPPAEVQTQPAAESATTAKIKNILLNNSVFWSRLGWPYNPPVLDENGNARMMLSDDSPEKKFHGDFDRAGIKIHSTILFSGWIAPAKYDYRATDKALDDLFASVGKDSMYIPRIKLDPPPSWCAENPEDTTVYYPGGLSKEEIAELACTPAHDWFGMELPNGYTTDKKVRGKPDPRPNVRGLIGMQSFSSEKWLRDAGEALRRLIRHIESGKYGKNVIAYHIAYGQCGETSFWRGWEKNDYRFGDYGINNLRAFYDWGIRKYGSREALAKAWGQPGISRDNVKLPTPMKRELHWNSHADFFRAAPDNLSSIDYEKFCGEMNARAIEYFSKIVKEESGKAAGAFYGYYLFVPRAAYNGHLEFDKLLDSPYVDFLASPKGYRNVKPGGPGMEQTPPMSVNRKKIFIDELDVRTHLSCWPDAKDMGGTRTMLWREFSKCMQSGSGFWWMDLHGGWFDSKEVMDEIKKIESAAKDMRAEKRVPTAQVLIVTDTESFHCAKPSLRLHRDLVVDTIARIRMAGAPADHYRLSDLKSIDLSGYKAVLFINCFRVTDSDWAEISGKMSPNTSLVWHYAPAVWSDSYDPARSESITGFKIAERPISDTETAVFSDPSKGTIKADFSKKFDNKYPEKPYPLFGAVGGGEGFEPIAKYTDSTAALAKTRHGKFTSYFVSLPLLDSESYRRIFDAAGVESPAPANCAVYADSRFCAIFPSEPARFKLPLKGEFVDAVSGKTVRGGEEIYIPGKGALLLRQKK